MCVDHDKLHLAEARLKAVVGNDHGVGDVASSDGSSADRSSRALRRQGSKRKLVPSEYLYIVRYSLGVPGTP